MSENKRIEVDPELYSVIQNSIMAGVNEGVKKALIELEKEKEEKKKHKADMRYRNTELLLHNYTNFMEHAENSIYTEEQLKESDLLDELDLEEDEERVKTQINSILQSKKKTAIILHHINAFLDYYRYKCESSGREDIERRYKVIKHLFLVPDEEKKTQEEMSAFLNCDARTIRRTKNVAIKELSVLFFGIDGLKIR